MIRITKHYFTVKHALVFILTLLIIFSTHSISTARVFYLEDINESLYLPKNYDQIPKEKWEDFITKETQSMMSKEYFKNNYDAFDYLFHKNTNKFFMNGPYIFILTKRARSISKEEFKNYIHDRVLPLENNIKEMQEAGTYTKDVSMKFIGKTFVDYEKKYVYYKIETTTHSINWKVIIYQYIGYYPMGTLAISFATYSGPSVSTINEQDEEEFMKTDNSLHD